MGNARRSPRRRHLPTRGALAPTSPDPWTSWSSSRVGTVTMRGPRCATPWMLKVVQEPGHRGGSKFTGPGVGRPGHGHRRSRVPGWQAPGPHAGRRRPPLCAGTASLSLSDEEATLLVSMSAASIDRHLAKEQGRCPGAVGTHRAGDPVEVPDPGAHLGRVDRGHPGLCRGRPRRP